MLRWFEYVQGIDGRRITINVYDNNVDDTLTDHGATTYYKAVNIIEILKKYVRN